MFLSDTPSELGPHELDFRFEAFPADDEFLFAHHGAKLSELLETCGQGSLGSTFYIVEMAYPLTLADAAARPGLFSDRYGVEPAVVHGRYLRFDSRELARFFGNTAADTELDCTVFGTRWAAVSEQDLQRFLDAVTLQAGRVRLADPWPCSWLHTHDNHFLWLAARPLGLLRRLVASSLLGFFRHVRPHPYAPVPEALIDLIQSRYHTAPLVCFPTTWDSATNAEVPSGVQDGPESVRALVEAVESSWIAYRLNPPRELVGRGLLISYLFQNKAWSFEEWR